LLESRGIPLSVQDEVFEASRPKGLRGLVEEEAFETTGEIIGVIGGARVGAPIRGAAVGRAAGSAVKDIFELITRPERQVSITQDFSDVALDGAEGLLSEFASRKVFNIAATLLKPSGKTRIFGAEAAQEQLEQAGKRVIPRSTLDGGDIPPQVGESALDAIEKGLSPVIQPGARVNNPIIRTMDNVTAKAVSAMSAVQKTKLGANIPAFVRRTKDVLSDMATAISGLPASMKGAMLNDILGNGGSTREAFKDVYRSIYSQVDDLAGFTYKPVTRVIETPTGIFDDAGKMIMKKVSVETEELVSKLGVSNAAMKKKMGRLIDQVKNGQVLKGSEEGSSFVRDMATMADTSNFSQSIQNRSTIMDWARRFEELGDNRAAKIANEGAELIRESMEQAAIKQGKGVDILLKQANSVFKEYIDTFENKAIREIVKTIADEPELVTKTIFQDGKVTRINRVKKILLDTTGKTRTQITQDKNAWKELQRSWVEFIFDKSSDREGIVIGTRLKDALGENGMGKEGFKAIFPDPAQRKVLREFANLGEFVQGEVVGEGGMLIQLMQPSAAAAVVAGRTPAQKLAGAAVFALPGVWADIMTDPKKASIIVNGLVDLKAHKGVEAAAPRAIQALRTYLFTREEFLKNQEQRNIEQKKARQEAFKKASEARSGTGPGFGGAL
jgi:hypothetical protein